MPIHDWHGHNVYEFNGVIFTDAILDRVRKGAAWLDEVLSPDWYLEIDDNSLDLSSAHACILGQLFAEPGAYLGYYRVVNEGRFDKRRHMTLGHTYEWSAEHGFEVYRQQPHAYRAKLTAAWRYVIDERYLEAA